MGSRSFLFLVVLLACVGCAPAVPRVELNVSQLVQTSPDDLRQTVVLPAGLETVGDASLRLSVDSPDPGLAAREDFKLSAVDRARRGDGSTVTTYRLNRSDFRRFAAVQVRLRAALLTIADVAVDLDSRISLCDRLDTGLQRSPTPSLLLTNDANGRDIYRQTFGGEAADWKRIAPVCP